MTSPFEFMSAGRVLFGRGCFARVAELARPLGRRCLVVTGRSATISPGSLRALKPEIRRGRHRARAPEPLEDADRAPQSPVGEEGRAPGRPSSGARFSPRGSLAPFDDLVARMSSAGMTSVHFVVSGEPTTLVADEGARLAIASGCEAVIGLGGGSVLDAAKAIAALMTNGGEALDYLEVAGRGRALENPAAPCIAIPTTAGTGSEVTKNAVLTEPRARVKASMRSPHMLPAIAIVDPELTQSLPPHLTAWTALDALTQLLEAYLTPRANAMTDLFALEGITRSARSLLSAVDRGDDDAAREDLALASLFGGFALANAGLGAVHGIAAPLGGRHPVPHGLACAALLPPVFGANLTALRRADPGGMALARMARIGETLVRAYRSADGSSLEDPGEDPADAAADLLRHIVRECRVPGLASLGVGRSDIPPLIEGALRASSMKGNPVALSPDEIGTAIVAAL